MEYDYKLASKEDIGERKSEGWMIAKGLSEEEREIVKVLAVSPEEYENIINFSMARDIFSIPEREKGIIKQ